MIIALISLGTIRIKLALLGPSGLCKMKGVNEMNLKCLCFLVFILVYSLKSDVYAIDKPHDLRLSISFSQNTFYIGGPLIVSTKLDNLSNKDLMVYSIGGRLSNAINYKIEQKFGEAIADEVLTVNSENEFSAEGWDVRLGANIIKLEAGGSLVWMKDIFEVLNVRVPGKYTLHAYYKDPEGTTIQSERRGFCLEKYDCSDKEVIGSIRYPDKLNFSKNIMSVTPTFNSPDNKEIVSELIGFVSSKTADADTRFYAITALGKIKAREAIPFLQAIVEDAGGVDYFKHAAFKSIKKIQKSPDK